MKQLEIEYKILLSRKEFLKLTKKFEQAPLVSQTNYYFDTDDFQMRQAKLALRIRRLKNHAELTLKIPQKVGNFEYNMELTLAETKRIIDAQTLPVNAITQLILDRGIALAQIKNIGQLTTYRREIELPIGLMAIDENHYADKVDYELELEVQDPDKGKADFYNFLKQEKIHFKYAKSKVVRFVSTLNKTK